MNIAPVERSTPATPALAVTPSGVAAQVQAPAAAAAGADAAAPVELPAASAVTKAAERMEEHARSVGRSLQFRVDESSGRVVVSVRDRDTGELIRQIPSEAALRVARDLDSVDSGRASLLIDGEA